MDAKWFDELAVLHAGGTGGFTGPAIQAQIEVTAHLTIELKPAIGHGAHQVNSSARTVVFIAQLHIGGTSRGAQPTMNAIQEQFIIDIGGLGRDYRQRGSWQNS